jgi:hypothetical protein
MDKRFAMWNVKCVYRAGSLKTVARKLILGEEGRKAWTRFIWIRIVTRSRLL